MSPVSQLGALRLARRDLGNLLFHFTRKQAERRCWDGNLERASRDAFSILSDILGQGVLRAGSGFIRGGNPCVCFTEAPITELAATFAHARYEPYGIAVKKDWLFQRGGRPVIYQSDEEYRDLPESLQYRHVRYEPHNEIDFTWEREWRVKVNELVLDPREVLVVVAANSEVNVLNHLYSENHSEGGSDGEVFRVPKWSVVSLELFGVQPTADFI